MEERIWMLIVALLILLNAASVFGPYMFGAATANFGSGSVLVLALMFISLFAVVIYAFYYMGKKDKDDLKKEYEELKENREALKKLMKSIMHEYYTRKISPEDARRRLLDYEKEIIIQREKMKGVLHKLGLKRMETDDKEELIEWIVEKLGDGEDAELLKDALLEAGMDPKIVDEIKKNLS